MYLLSQTQKNRKIHLDFYLDIEHPETFFLIHGSKIITLNVILLWNKPREKELQRDGRRMHHCNKAIQLFFYLYLLPEMMQINVWFTLFQINENIPATQMKYFSNCRWFFLIIFLLCFGCFLKRIFCMVHVHRKAV